MYTETQKREIEKVILVFNNYIQASDYIDLVRSEKIGYILLYFNSQTHDLEMEPAVITDGSELCELLLSEIASDVLELTKNEHRVSQADPLEKAEIIKRMEPFAERLPEYNHLFKELFTNANE